MRALLVPAALCLGFGAFGGAASLSACGLSAADVTATETAAINAGSCIVSQAISGNVTPVGIIAACSSQLVAVTEQLIVDAIDAFTAQHVVEAGAALLAPSLTAQQLQSLQQARANAVIDIAAKASGK